MQCYLDFFMCDLSVFILFYCHRTSYLVNMTIYLDIYIIYSKVHILSEYIINHTFIKVNFSAMCFKLAAYVTHSSLTSCQQLCPACHHDGVWTM